MTRCFWWWCRLFYSNRIQIVAHDPPPLFKHNKLIIQFLHNHPHNKSPLSEHQVIPKTVISLGYGPSHGDILFIFVKNIILNIKPKLKGHERVLLLMIEIERENAIVVLKHNIWPQKAPLHSNLAYCHK